MFTIRVFSCLDLPLSLKSVSAYFNDVLLSCVLVHALYPANSCHEDSRSAAFIGLTSTLAGHTFLLEFISELLTVSVYIKRSWNSFLSFLLCSRHRHVGSLRKKLQNNKNY